MAMSFMAAPTKPFLNSFNMQVWNAVQPLVQAMTWNAASAPGSAYLSVPSLQQTLGITSPLSSAPPSTGDPYIDWVDSMLYSGQPLAAGSAQLYGENGNNTAFQALDQAIGLSLEMVSQSLAVTPFGAGLNMGMAAANGDAAGVLIGAASIVGMLAPCAFVGKGVFAAGERGAAVAIELTSTGSLVGKAANAFTGVMSAVEFAQTGDFTYLAGALGSLAMFFNSCFTGDMLVDMEGGKKRADEIQAGDRIWSRNEYEPDGPLALKEVEEVFVRVAPILNLRVGGQT
jgi:hypothetical protein